MAPSPDICRVCGVVSPKPVCEDADDAWWAGGIVVSDATPGWSSPRVNELYRISGSMVSKRAGERTREVVEIGGQEVGDMRGSDETEGLCE